MSLREGVSLTTKTHQENQHFKEALLNAKARFDKDETVSPMILYKEMGLYYKMVKSYMQNFNDVHLRSGAGIQHLAY